MSPLRLPAGASQPEAMGREAFNPFRTASNLALAPTIRTVPVDRAGVRDQRREGATFLSRPSATACFELHTRPHRDRRPEDKGRVSSHPETLRPVCARPGWCRCTRPEGAHTA